MSPKQARKAARAARDNQGHDGNARRLRPGLLSARPKPSPGSAAAKGAKGSGRKGAPEPKSRKKGKDKSAKPGKKAAARTRSMPMSSARRLAYGAGRVLRRNTSRRARERMRAAAAPFRTAGRAARRYGSPLLAHVWRYGSRGVLRAHMALGNVRYSTIGPNWLRPLARVFHTVTTPAARAVAWAGQIGWLNRWMYEHTSGGTRPTPRRPSTGRRGNVRPHNPVAAPKAPTTNPAPMKGASVSALEPTLPLRYAAETVRNAGAMLLLNPAENMAGFEATMHALTEVQTAIGDVIRAASMNARENFKVSPAIPEAYDDTSVYAHALAGRLESIPTLYRIIHAEQIDNLENPTPQAAKWDIGANNQ